MLKKHTQNLHVHSVYCDGKDTPEEMIAAAMAAGLDSLGFSIHSYMSCSKSGFLSLEKQAAYNAEIERLKAKYKDNFPVYRGVEFDIYADSPWDGYDYTIASVHYLHTHEGLVSFDTGLEKTLAYVEKYFESDGMKFAKAYYEALSTAADYGKFDIIGHFDLVTKNNELHHFIDTDTARYRSFVADAVSALRGKIPFFELNTGAIARGYRTSPYPAMDILKLLRESGFGATISSDCHDKQYVDFGYDLAAEFLREAGYNSKFIFNGKDFEEVAL